MKPPGKELEKRGIGRPSTYASIISTIQDRGYVRVENRRFYAEKMGEIVTDRLEANFRELMNYDFTAQMEDSLDQLPATVRNGKRSSTASSAISPTSLKKRRKTLKRAACCLTRWY